MCQNLNLNSTIDYFFRKPSISTVQFAEVKEKDVETGLGNENPQQKRLRRVLSAVSRFKNQSRRFRPTSDFEKADRNQSRRFRPTSDFEKADRAQLEEKKGETQSRLGKFIAKYKASLIKVWSITSNILLCTFDSGTDSWAARSHYM